MDDLPTQALPPSDEDKASTASKTSMEIEAQHKDNLVCPQHAGEKIVVVSVNESTDDLRLFCVSCMISDGGRTHDPTYKKLTLKDFFERILAKPKDNSMDQIEAEIKKKYVDFLAKDYKSLYDKEMNKQYQLLVNEIDGITKGLNDFKEKIKDTIAGKINDICFKMEEVTRESNKFIEEGDNQSQIHFNSINEIYENLERMGDWKQTYGFFKDIYLKSKEKLFEENSPQKRGAKVMNKINDFETRFNKQITESIDLSKLKEIRRTVNILLDYSFIYSGETHISESSPGIKLEMVSPSECNSDCGEECRLFEGYHRIQKRPETFIDDYSLREEYSMNSVFERPIKTLVPRKKKPFFRIGSQSLRKMKKGYNSNKENIEDTSTHKRVAAEPLRDWINRRITGYLIFRNTVKAYPGYMEELKKKNEEEYGHMNKAMGNIWRNLDSQERSLYDDIALNYRKAYTAKVDALVNSDCTGRSLGELMEEFDQTSTRLVRKIEKERS